MAMCPWSFTSSQAQHERSRKQISMQNEKKNKTTVDLISLSLIVGSHWPDRGTNKYGCTYIIRCMCIVTYWFN